MNINASKIATEATTRVVLVDDHELARQGIKKLLVSDISIEIVGEAATCNEAISLINQVKPEVVLLDIRLQEGSGIDVARFIKSNMPETKILVLTAHNDHQYVRAMARIGVSGYLIKTVSAEQLQKSIREVIQGCLVFPENTISNVTAIQSKNTRKKDTGFKVISSSNHKQSDTPRNSKSLTSKEAEVFEYVSCGLRNYEVANQMDISIKTVEAHMKHILRKLGARNRTQAVSNANLIKEKKRHHS